MNAPQDEDPLVVAPLPAPLAENTRRRRLDGGIGIAVLAANVVATAMTVVLWHNPFAFDQGFGAIAVFTYVGSLAVSIFGGLALAIRQNNPWWLITIPWAVALCSFLVFLARELGRGMIC
jgi:hypothetical protein